MSLNLAFKVCMFYCLTFSAFSQSYSDCKKSKYGLYDCDKVGWTKLPPKIPEDCTKLYVNDNEISTFTSEQLQQLEPKLGDLRFARNNFTSLHKDQFKGALKLYGVNFDENDIGDLPEDVFTNTPNMFRIEFRKNKFTSIPDKLCKWIPRLYQMDFQDNEIKELTDTNFQGCTKLRGLYLQNNQIEKIGENTFGMLKLTKTKMTTSLLTGSWPLYALHLEHNNITTLPKKFVYQISPFQKIYLHHNQISHFPFMDLIPNWNDQLVTLDLSYNKLAHISETFMDKMKHLPDLLIRGNPFICDCSLDWMRRVYEFAHTISGYAMDHILKVRHFGPKIPDLMEVTCAGPGPLITGKKMRKLATLCDKDECKANKNICKAGPMAVCVNTIGSYECNCDYGYYGNGKFACLDLNECEIGGLMNMQCNYSVSLCTNTIGSYFCTCRVGFRDANATNYNCTDINECDDFGVCPESAKCINTPGSFKCQCPDGFRQQGTRCVDIDECKGKHGCKTKCYNYQGFYTCDCPKGFYLGDDEQCHDENECEGDHGCHKYGLCINKNGTYDCVCSPGFHDPIKDGNCFDVDECSYFNMNGCHMNATCVNTIGNFECKCNGNLLGDGKVHCGSTDVRNQKYINAVSSQMAGGVAEGGSSTVIIIGAISAVVVLGFVAAIFIFRPAALFKPKTYGGEVRRVGDEDITTPLKMDQD